MIDLVKLSIQAGDGGDGRISLHREKYRPKGGPDGGNGGNGGNVIIRGNKNINTLHNYAGVKKYAATDGQPGGKNKQHGFKGEDLVLEVPLGTVVWLIKENDISRVRRKKYQKPLVNFDFENTGDEQNDLDIEQTNVDIEQNDKTDNIIKENDFFRLNTLFQRKDLSFQKFYKDWGEHKPDPKPVDTVHQIQLQQEKVEVKEFSNLDKILDSDFDEFNKTDKLTGIKLVEIREHGQTEVVCQGGFGGRGNHAFRGPSNQTPLEAEYGSYGEKKEVILELRLLADLGLVGFPNAGKSTLLSRITKANPKIANYPFTTLEPNLGVLMEDNGEREMVVADIPGLIEGANLGKGLGNRFLRHIENCQKLLYVLFFEEHLVYDEEISAKAKADQLWKQYQQLRKELGDHHQFLLEKPSLVALNKIDIYDEDLIKAVLAKFKKEGEQLLLFSGVTGEGLEQLKRAVFDKE